MKLQQLLKCLPYYKQINKGNPMITSLEMDSREVQKGSMFICIKGFTVDGHDFVKQAIDQGAVAILAEKQVDADIPVVIVNDTKRVMAVLADYFYQQPTKSLHLIGVTGTNGKTTVTYLLDHIFQNNNQKTGLIGTIHIKIGEKTYDVKNTTPESLLLHKTFAQMKEQKVESAFMEVSSHALDMGRVRGCDFDIAIFTNLTQDHLDYHQTMADYRRAKGLLFSQLGNSYDHQRPKFAVLNQDDPATEEYKRMTAAHLLTYGIDQKADVMAKEISITSRGTSFLLITPEGSVNVNMSLVGEFSVYNVLAAAAASIASGIPLEIIHHSIEKMQGVPGRFELVDEGQPFTVIVDYAHTPDSLENVLKTIKQFAKKNIYVVVGCGGDRDRTKRPKMAKVSADYADYPIFTSDNPRTEDPKLIIREMETGVQGKQYKVILDRKEAIYQAITQANEDDIVLIAGKGHETYQEVGKERYHFDDREIAKMVIKERIL